MNDRQRRFADGVLSGLSATEAYEKAGYKARGAAAESKASRLVRNGKVAAYMAEKRKETEAEIKLTKTIVFDRLHEIVTKGEDRDSISAIARAAKMLGWDAPEKSEVREVLDWAPPDTTTLAAINGTGRKPD
jgi:phage terminase small subunit